MSTSTTNMSLLKAVDGDNSKTYLETSLAGSLDTLDAHDHGATARGLPVTRGTAMTVTSGLTVSTGGITVTAGNVGIGQAAADYALQIAAGALTSNQQSQYGLVSQPVTSVNGTVESAGLFSRAATAVAAFTVTSAIALHAGNALKGAGSTITSAYGLLVDVQNQGNTNNYGIYIGTPTGGSADNFSLVSMGPTIIGNVSGTTATSGFAYLPYVGGTPTGVPVTYSASNHLPLVLDSVGLKLWCRIGGAWKSVTFS